MLISILVIFILVNELLCLLLYILFSISSESVLRTTHNCIESVIHVSFDSSHIGKFLQKRDKLRLVFGFRDLVVRQ